LTDWHAVKANIEETNPSPVPGISINNVKSRKENIQDSPHGTELNFGGNGSASHKQPFPTTNNGAKRQRVVTPAACKVIDTEDEPRTSPSLRKISRGSAKQEVNGGERTVLGGIENALSTG